MTLLSNLGLKILFPRRHISNYKSSRPCQKSVIEMILKRRLQARKRSHVIRKKVVDDVEEVWLENLTQKNLKLYRKTSFGSFKKININRFLDKLKQLYSLDYSVKNVEEKAQTEFVPERKAPLASPYISDFLLQNMIEFPLLRSDCNGSLKAVVKNDRDDFGIVDAIKFPSVTRILNETMSENSRQKLQIWKNKMIQKLGIDGFYKQQEDPVVSSKVFVEVPRKRKRIVVDILNQGAKFHGFLKKYLESKDEKVIAFDPVIEGCCRSIRKLLPDISNVLMIEEPLHHPVLMYKGIVDCVASYRGVPCVIEWKKSERKKLDLTSTHDAPLQLCAYLGALAWKKNFTPLLNGLVVVAYTDGTEANVFNMDLECCQVYWNEWLQRLQKYWATKSSTFLQVEAEV